MNLTFVHSVPMYNLLQLPENRIRRTILRLLAGGKTAAYFAYVRIFTTRQTPKEPL